MFSRRLSVCSAARPICARMAFCLPNRSCSREFSATGAVGGGGAAALVAVGVARTGACAAGIAVGTGFGAVGVTVASSIGAAGGRAGVVVAEPGVAGAAATLAAG